MKSTKRRWAVFLTIMMLLSMNLPVRAENSLSDAGLEEENLTETESLDSQINDPSPIDFFLDMFLSYAAPKEQFGAAWTNSDIAGAISESTQTRVQDDYYTAVNKDWILSQDIGTDEQVMQLMLTEAVLNQRMHDIVTDPESTGYADNTEVGLTREELLHAGGLITSFSEVFGNVEKRNAEGAEPLRPYLERIEKISTMEEFSDYLADGDGMNLIGSPLVDFKVEPVHTHPGEYRVVAAPITPGMLMLGAPGQYEAINSDGICAKELHSVMVEHILGKLGYQPGQIRSLLTSAYMFESRIAAFTSYAFELETDEYLLNNSQEFALPELETMLGGYPVSGILALYGYDHAKSIVVREPETMARIGELYKPENLEELKAYYIVSTAFFASDLLDMETKKLYYDLSEQELPDDPTDALIQDLQAYLPAPIDMVYIGAYCTAAQKAEVMAMTQRIKAQVRSMLEDVMWLSEEGKSHALQKLDNMDIRAVYPDKYISWNGLSLSGEESLPDITHKINLFNKTRYAYRVDSRIDRSEWDLALLRTTQTNAYNLINENSIMILAGILANGFVCDPALPDEVNLARLGTIVGHEITHGFDTMGYMYDKLGWKDSLGEEFAMFSEQDKSIFSMNVNVMTMWYAALTPIPGDGNYTAPVSGEAIADMGGMKSALGVAREMENFDYDLFFRSYAQLWRCVNSLDAEKAAGAADPHPLPFLRTNVTVQQFDEFMETYQVKPGDGMYLDPFKRILVW